MLQVQLLFLHLAYVDLGHESSLLFLGHGEQGLGFDIFEDETGEFEPDWHLSIVVVVLPEALGELLLELDSRRVADLESFNAESGVADWQDAGLLEAHINNDSSLLPHTV